MPRLPVHGPGAAGTARGAFRRCRNRTLRRRAFFRSARTDLGVAKPLERCLRLCDRNSHKGTERDREETEKRPRNIELSSHDSTVPVLQVYALHRPRGSKVLMLLIEASRALQLFKISLTFWRIGAHKIYELFFRICCFVLA